jgi:hypothetical protein
VEFEDGLVTVKDIYDIHAQYKNWAKLNDVLTTLYGQSAAIKWLDPPPVTTKDIADGLVVGIKVDTSAVAVAMAKLETAGARAALYQSEKERAKLEKELEESRALRKIDEGLIENLNVHLRQTEELHRHALALYESECVTRDSVVARAQRLDKALADANDRITLYVEEKLQLEQRTEAVETELEEAVAAVGRQDTLLGILGKELADANERSIAYRKENERLKYNLWAIEKIAEADEQTHVGV